MATIANFFVQFYSKFVQNVWWEGLRLKWGLLKHKMSLGFISFTTVHAKWPIIVPNFVKTLTSQKSVKTKHFSSQNSVLFRFSTSPFCLWSWYVSLIQVRRYLSCRVTIWCHDTQPNDIQYKHTQHDSNKMWHPEKQCNTQPNGTLN